MTPTYINFDKKHKREDKRFLKYKIIAGVAGFLILLGGIFYAVAYSPLFKITQINTDNRLADVNLTDNLKSFLAGRSKIAEFLGPDNILVWTAGGLKDFEKGPEIAEISLKKDYTERMIEIDVKLRERFGVWCENGQQANASSTEQQTTESCWWFDKDGVLFGIAPELEGNAINKVDDFSSRDLKLGDLALEEVFIENLVKLFEVLERSDIGIRALKLKNLDLQEIIFDQPQTSLPKIYFSLRFNSEFLLSTIEGLKKIGLQKMEYVDFRVENRVYYKLK